MRGAVILAAASAVSRVIGLAYMVVLPRIIYADGMGLYQLVKPIHYFAAVLAIAGMPVAMAKMIAEEAAKKSMQNVNKIFRLGFLLIASTGALTALALILGAPLFARLFAQEMGVQKTIAILGFSCFLLALEAGMRGLFQGLQFMLPSALAQVLSQTLRVVSTIGFCLWLRPQGVEQAVTGIGWGSWWARYRLAGYARLFSCPQTKAAGWICQRGKKRGTLKGCANPEKAAPVIYSCRGCDRTLANYAVGR